MGITEKAGTDFFEKDTGSNINEPVNANMESESHSQKPTIKVLRSKTTATQKHFLDEFWQSFRRKGEWAMNRVVYSKHATDVGGEALPPLAANVVREDNHQSGQTIFQ